MKTPEICEDERRRQNVREHKGADGQPDLNGIEYIEVGDCQRTLHVYLLGKAPQRIGKKNIVINGGRRVTDIVVTDVDVCQADDKDLDDCVKVTVNKPGDFSCYTLRLVETDERGRPTNKPLRGFDPRFAEFEFSFKAGCPTDLDCLTDKVCPPEPLPQPEINYLAKDYASFRQLIFDRLSLGMPEWRERHVPDIGVTLVELLAYAGDHLSYYQDAVATEAYLETARQRISVRRHARLVDYLMHDGCNARAWLFIETDSGVTLRKNEVQFITGYNNMLPANEWMLTRDELLRLNIRSSLYEIFEPVGDDDIRLFKAHNEIPFYTWDDFECCLPRGSTSATLRDEWVVGKPPEPPPDECDDDEPNQYDDKQTQAQGEKKKKHPPKPGPDQPQPERILKLNVGDVLIFEEVISPTTGEPSDVDRKHRHAVRLIRVTPGVDPLHNQPVVEIEWAEEDALPFTLCLSAVSAPPECKSLDNVSVARGNVILVDHGRTVETEDLGVVPSGETKIECGDTSCTAEVTIIPGRYNPRLKEDPLTFSQPLPAEATVVQPSTDDLPDEDEFVAPVEISAQSLLRQDPRLALPQIDLRSQSPGDWPEVKWSSRNDLLSSGEEDNHFVAEMDNFGRAHLRFGDGEAGRAPLADERFTATYRVGAGTAGNVGAEAISHVLLQNTRSGVALRPRNPMPAVGGAGPEPMAEAKLFAPYAFRSDLQRAVTAEDYATIAQRHPKVQRAAATLRWTGGWYEARVAVDPKSKVEADEKLLQQVTESLRPFRRIGHELKVAQAVYVPLEVEITVCVKPGYLRGHIKAALLDRFSNRVLIDGTKGFFHPDSLTFGEGVLISKLVAAAQSVTGVENVIVSKLRRYGELPGTELEDGILKITPLEIARLNNDPDFPENGTIKFDLGGGR
jgi:hypothetical protein